ncbi:hypothetical protein [Edaphobacter aggregans]|uniref:hypothetical protein n=1 Tax=Edaphobacter aggregans TaxID=570835 RepID=UPI000ADB9C87|nr:hypothetical protein [Edaphobacter aggregans]
MRIQVLAVVLGMTMVGMAQSPGDPSSAGGAQGSSQGSSQGSAQGASPESGQSTSLVVPGRTGQAPVVQRNGRWYVDVEALARVTGGTLGFQGSRIVLTLPAAQQRPVQQQAAAPVTPPEEKGFTREFLRAGVEQMAVVREWRSALENAIRTNNPVEESWVSYYRRAASDKMAMASAAASTESDRRGIGLLQSEMGMIAQLTDRFLALRSNLTYVDPTSLDNDPLDQKILACAQGMAAIAVPGGMFEDVADCH